MTHRRSTTASFGLRYRRDLPTGGLRQTKFDRVGSNRTGCLAYGCSTRRSRPVPRCLPGLISQTIVLSHRLQRPRLSHHRSPLPRRVKYG